MVLPIVRVSFVHCFRPSTNHVPVRRSSGIETVGTKSNRDGIGSRVKVVSASGLGQYFTVNTAVGYLSASDKRLIVGLGDDSEVKLIEIRWPSGAVQKFENIKAGQMMKATEPVQ